VKFRRYYTTHREQLLDRAAAKRGRPRAEQRATCSECGDALEGRRRVVCSERCASARFSRLNPEAVARKVAAGGSAGASSAPPADQLPTAPLRFRASRGLHNFGQRPAFTAGRLLSGMATPTHPVSILPGVVQSSKALTA
jgi:hypothetical protein